MTTRIGPEDLARLREQTARRRVQEKAGRMRAASLACVHRGAPTGETFGCKACGSRERREEIYACSLYGKCSVRTAYGQLACCKACPDRATSEAPPRPGTPF
jgi:hypothetical protein